MKDARSRFVVAATIGYLLFGISWIFLSDRLLAITIDPATLVWLSTAKGLMFVVATAGGFFLALRAVPSAGAPERTPLLDYVAEGFFHQKGQRWLVYVLAVGVTVATLAARGAWAGQDGNRPLLVMLMFPIILSAMLGGLLPGLVSTAIAALGVDYFAEAPVGALEIASVYDRVHWLFLVVNGVLVSGLSEVLQRALERSAVDQGLLSGVVSGTSDAVFVKDLEGRYRLANAAAAAFLGRTVREVLGADDAALLPEGTARALRETDRSVTAEGRTVTLEERLETVDGRSLIFLVTKGPVRDKSGRVVGLFGVSRDVTERALAERRVRESEAFRRAIIDSVSAAIAVVDREGKITAVNRPWERLSRENAAQHGEPPGGAGVGANYLLACAPTPGAGMADGPDVRAEVQEVLDGRSEGFRVEYVCRPPRQARWFLMVVTPLELEPRGAVISHTDITERKLAELALRDSEWALREAQSLAGVGNWSWTVGSRGPVLSGELIRLLGAELDHGLTTPEGFARYFTPESWGQVASLLEACRAEGVAFECEAEIQLPGGVPRAVIARGAATVDASGNVVALHGTVQDFSARKQAEEAVRRGKAVLEAALGSMSDAVFVSDAAGRFLHFNDAFVSFHRFGAGSELPLALDAYPELLEVTSGGSSPLPVAEWAVPRALRGEVGVGVEFGLRRRDTGQAWIGSYNYAPIRDEAGHVVGSVVTARDITEARRAERAVREHEIFLRTMIENMPIPVFFQDPGGVYRGGNPAFDSFVMRRPEEVIGRTAEELFPDSLGAGALGPHAALLVAPGNVVQEGDVRRADGAMRTIVVHQTSFPDADGQVAGVIGAILDVTERKRAEDELRKLAQAVEQSPESIVITDTNGRIEYVNEAYVRVSGYTAAELIGQDQRLLHSGRTPRETYRSLWSALAEGRTWEGEFYNRGKSGVEFIEHAIISPIRQPDGRITNFLGIKEDITERRAAEARIHRLSNYDTLTELPNRTLLLQHVSLALMSVARTGHHGAFILVNLDRFKTVNDAGGQAMGDALLRMVGERLSQCLHGVDLVARIGGDEFGVLMTDLAVQKQSAASAAVSVGQLIHQCLVEPFRHGAADVRLSASLGIALFLEGDEQGPLDVLRRATTALHEAKKRGESQSAFFEASLDAIAQHRFLIERELRHAVSDGELRVYFQSQVDSTGRAVGAEALVRWQHPQRGLVPPGVFIPTAEESNLIVDIGVWVFTEVCRLVARPDIAVRPLRFSVNISPRHFRRVDFVSEMKQIIAETGADPAHLTFELTEGILVDDMNDAVAKMLELGALGIHFSMDDFGTGYSSLSYLKRLPIHELKIDKTFVQDVTTDANDASLVEAILAVAQHLHLRIVAEGVETAEQAAFLDARATVVHQGYYFGRPEPADDWLAKLPPE